MSFDVRANDNNQTPIGKATSSDEKRIATHKCAPWTVENQWQREVGRLTARRLLHLENI
jgi:hypothetical protein